MWRNGGILAVSGEHKVRPQKNALRRGHISPILLIPRLAYHRFFPSRANYMRDSRQHVDRPWPSNTRFRRELMPNSVRIRSFLRRGIAITGGWKSCSSTVREIRGFLGGRGREEEFCQFWLLRNDRGLRFLHRFFSTFYFPFFHRDIIYTFFGVCFFIGRKEGRKDGNSGFFFLGNRNSWKELREIGKNWRTILLVVSFCFVYFRNAAFFLDRFFRLFYRNNNSWEFSKFICSICTVVSSKTITHFCYLLFVLIFIA